ncbi:hypothetical protein AB4Z22_11875, partial [Paenibacillus sp. TAF58]
MKGSFAMDKDMLSLSSKNGEISQFAIGISTADSRVPTPDLRIIFRQRRTMKDASFTSSRPFKDIGEGAL